MHNTLLSVQPLLSLPILLFPMRIRMSYMAIAMFCRTPQPVTLYSYSLQAVQMKTGNSHLCRASCNAGGPVPVWAAPVWAGMICVSCIFSSDCAPCIFTSDCATCIFTSDCAPCIFTSELRYSAMSKDNCDQGSLTFKQ